MTTTLAMRSSEILLALAATLVSTTVGCDVEQPVPDSIFRTAAEAGMLAFVNDHEISTLAVLDDDCSLYSDSATNIDQYRAGDDLTYGTADDRTITSQAELDSIPQVGLSTVAALYSCAEAFGFIDTFEVGMLAFVNDHPVSTFEVLDDDCSLYSNAATNIDEYRAGDDLIYGTADDRTLQSEEELDAISRVGPATIAALYACAESFGYIEPSCDQPGNSSEVFTSGDDWEQAVPAALVTEIDNNVGLFNLCGNPQLGSGTSSFSHVTVSYFDCEPTTYEVQWVQDAEPEGQIVLTQWYDATLDLFDGTCEIQ